MTVHYKLGVLAKVSVALVATFYDPYQQRKQAYLTNPNSKNVNPTLTPGLPLNTPSLE